MCKKMDTIHTYTHQIMKKKIIVFLDSLGHVWDFKTNLHFSSVKIEKNLENFLSNSPSSWSVLIIVVYCPDLTHISPVPNFLLSWSETVKLFNSDEETLTFA